MNVEGSSWEDNFITTPKLVVIGLMLGSAVFMGFYLKENYSPLGSYIIFYALWFLICSLITRFYIFEEKYYYRMYKQLKESEISTPAVFWDIASIKDTDEGAILTYSDAKIAIMVKVERDTITGKTKDFKEYHYDAISDFYKDVVSQKYSFVQMNVMEQAGKDPRLAELSKVIYKSDNKNIVKLMEMEVGHIKNITHASLYESDYFLFYTNDVSKVDSIIGDITESLFKLLDGAYIGYQVLNSKDIVSFIKDEFGVNYFNSTEASLLMYSNNDNSMINPFNITGILWADGEEQTLNNQEKNKLRRLTSGVINETLKIKDMSLKKAIYRKETKNKIGFDFESLSKTTVNTNNKHVTKLTKQNTSSNNDDEEEYIDL